MSAWSGRGLNLRQWKEQSIAQPSILHRPQGKLWVPLRTQPNQSILPIVHSGDRVELGQALSHFAGSDLPAALAPLAGEVIGIQRLDHPYLGKGLDCALLRAEDEMVDAADALDTDAIGPQEILSRCRNAGILDELDGTPLDQKLSRAAREGCTILVADALDDQPYCTSKLRTLIERPSDVGRGTVLAATAVGASRSCIAAYRPASVAPYLPLDVEGVPVLELTGRYPCLPELMEQMRLWGKGIRIGVQAAAALSRAVSSLSKQRSVMVTVGGPCVRTAANFRVVTGTLTSELIQQCAIRRKPGLVVYGGAMTGRLGYLEHPVPITPQMTSILLYPPPSKAGTGRCVGCGRCSEVCPMGLIPALIARAYYRGSDRSLKGLHSNRCIGCGCCSFVCPMGCDVSQAAYSAAHRLNGRYYCIPERPNKQ